MYQTNHNNYWFLFHPYNIIRYLPSPELFILSLLQVSSALAQLYTKFYIFIDQLPISTLVTGDRPLVLISPALHIMEVMFIEGLQSSHEGGMVRRCACCVTKPHYTCITNLLFVTGHLYLLTLKLILTLTSVISLSLDFIIVCDSFKSKVLLTVHLQHS